MKKFSDQGRNHDKDLQGNMGRELCQIICLQDGIAILMEISLFQMDMGREVSMSAEQKSFHCLAYFDRGFHC